MEALQDLSFSGFDVLDRLPEAISIVGPDGVPLHTNAAARVILDDVRSPQDGRPTVDVLWGALDASGAPLPNERLPIEITRLTGEECSDVEIGLPDAAGHERWLRVSTRRLSDQGPCFAVVASFVDVSAARRTRRELDRERSRYQTVVESLHEGVIMLDADGQIVAANASAGEVLGLTREQLLGRTSIDPQWHAIHPDGSDWPAEDHAAQRVRATGEPQLDLLMGVHTPDGPLRWLRVNATPLHDADGTLTGAVATFVDETDNLRGREALARATKLVSTAFADAPVGMALVGLDGAWLKVNRSICDLTGYTEAELLARTFQEITHPDDLDADLEQVRRLLTGEIERYAMEKRYFTASGDLIWANLSVSLVSAPDGTPEHFISHIEDITERKQLERSLQRLADHDPLTELWNRRRFEEELQRQVARCKRYGEQAALFILDLDDFKQVNDTLGHKAGDDLLRAVTVAMRARLRSTDALARLGGDEFAVLVANVTPEQAAVLADELAETIRSNPVNVRGRQIGATASIGIALLDRSVESDEAVLIAADVAMYQAKAAGRDRTSTRLCDEADPRSSAPGIRVLHCDESGPFRRLVELMLEGYPDISLVGSVAEHAVAVDEAHRLRPDVVLLDAGTPGDTETVIAAIKTVAPDCRVAIVSALDDLGDPASMAADSFILKTRTFDSIAADIRRLRA